MARNDGTAAHAVDETLQQLKDAPHSFDFFQALRLLECLFADEPRYGHSIRLSDDRVRLTQEPSLSFAPASLYSFAQQENSKFYELSVRFFGLCGPNGALPLHLTEYVRDRIRHHDDDTLAAFLNVFHHRMLSFFYRAWADANPAVHFDRPDTDRFSVYVGSLFGIGMQPLENRDALPDLAKLFYAGTYACQTRHPDGLRAMIEDFFDMPCNIEEFVGEWIELPEQCQFRIGDKPESSTVGVTCTLGSHVWDCQHKFRITIGPVGWDQFHRLLPGEDSLERLKAMVKNYLGDQFLWDVNVILRKEETQSWCLGDGKLGQTIWMDSQGVTEDSQDLVLRGEAN